jgi:hypothetical protein
LLKEAVLIEGGLLFSMRYNVKLAFGFLSLAFVIALAGCMSAPKVVDPAGVDISVVKLTRDQAVMSYGGGSLKEPNPYRMPGGILMGQPHELIVLRFSMVASRNAQVFVNSITARTADGASVARYDELDEYAAYISGWKSPLTERNVQIVRDSYIPGSSFKIRPGRHTYYAVLIGKNPIPRPFKVSVDIYVDEGNSRFFDIDVPQ